MDFNIETDEESIDLSKYSTIDSCLWLLNRLRVNDYQDSAYSLPFLSYVLSWYKAVPLTCIIMAQSPYPQNVYPPIAAAMSYDTELAKIQVKRRIYKVPVPPTVHIFANDMYINAGMNKADTIAILKNGWRLVEKGILLVNEGVFTIGNSSEYYDESVNQCNTIIRLLQETEKYGPRTVDIYGLGEAGQRMASNLCSWYKSSIVKLSKHTTTHPAALSRRFTDFDDKNCHMNTPSFSKSLARHFSNHVAFIHTMAKKSDAEIRNQQYADLIRTCAIKLEEYQKAQIDFNNITAEIRDMDFDDKEKVKEMFNKLCIFGTTLSTRAGITASAMQGVQRMGNGTSNYISKSAPSLQNPSSSSLNNHVGQEYKPAQQLVSKPTKITLTKSRNSLPIINSMPSTENISSTGNSSIVQVSSPPSIISTQSIRAPTKIKLTKSTNSTPNKVTNTDITSTKSLSEVTQDDVINDIDIEPEKEEPRTKSSMSAHFRKTKLTVNSKDSNSSGNQNNNQLKGGPLHMTSPELGALSAIEAVLEIYKDGFRDDEECIEKLELVQHDIQNTTKYNFETQALAEAINKDLERDPKFNFVDWAIDNSKQSYTYDKCREIFEF